MSPVGGRIRKNWARVAPWARRLGIEAFRIYDRDIPEYPFIVDYYKGHAVVFDRREAHKDFTEKKSGHLEALLSDLPEVLGISGEQIVLKERRRQSGTSQYEKLGQKNMAMEVAEPPARFWVNLYDYLDTGLFLDHRLVRQKIHSLARNKEFLNLFAYTGTASVMAALGGARTTTVDLSNTYIDWAKKNFELNSIDLKGHHFVVEDARAFLKNSSQRYDLIFLDPPTFSNSKSLSSDFEVERDQFALIRDAVALLRQDGLLIFSNNKRGFRLDPKVSTAWKVTETTPQTIPFDYRDPNIHKVFEIRHFSPS